MKRIQCFLFNCLFLFSLAGCSSKQVSETNMTPAEIAEAVAESQPELPAMEQIVSKEEEFATWITDYYLLQAENVEDGVICYADGVEAGEIAVLVLKDEEDCKEVEAALAEYIQSRAGVFEGYAPQQAAMVKGGVAAVNGRYAALLICPDPNAAKAAFLGCFGNSSENSNKEKVISAADKGAGELSESVKTTDSYDEEAILQAWRSGDDSALSERNRSILGAAKEVIASEIDDSMSDYEKELAVHDYITDWSTFDYSVFGRTASEGFADGSDTPYGVLVNRSAMCHGYSATFQLLMGMLDIECITVYGIPGSNGVEHSWNMVKLDGEWYCVDCAWDDPIGGKPGHDYFNVTSDYMRRGGIHNWDESSVPEATGTVYAYGNP